MIFKHLLEFHGNVAKSFNPTDLCDGDLMDDIVKGGHSQDIKHPFDDQENADMLDYPFASNATENSTPSTDPFECATCDMTFRTAGHKK